MSIVKSNAFKIRDSGKRQEFATGSRRDTSEGKARPDLISPWALERIGNHMGKGAAKYGAHNWSKGQPASRYYESACRHLMQYAQGDVVEDHLAAVCFNVMAIMHGEEMVAAGVFDAGLNDRYDWTLGRVTVKRGKGGKL